MTTVHELPLFHSLTATVSSLPINPITRTLIPASCFLKILCVMVNTLGCRQQTHLLSRLNTTFLRMHWRNKRNRLQDECQEHFPVSGHSPPQLSPHSGGNFCLCCNLALLIASENYYSLSGCKTTQSLLQSGSSQRTAAPITLGSKDMLSLHISV